MKYKIHDIVLCNHEVLWVKIIFDSISELRLEDIYGNRLTVAMDDCQYLGRADNLFDFIRFVESH